VGEGCFFDDFVDAGGEDEAEVLLVQFSLIWGVFEKGEGTYIRIAIGKYKLIWNQSPNLAPRTGTRR
jgi:hypothetical protein